MNMDKWYKEIRDLVQSSENPLFFFDDDEDGLCSFLLLWKHIKKGKGIINSFNLVMLLSVFYV